MPSQKLTPTFCMEDMDTLDMPDTMDIPMVDMPTIDKLFPLISKCTTVTKPECRTDQKS